MAVLLATEDNMGNMLVTLIIALCKPEAGKLFLLHGEQMTCHDYYVNCVIGSNGDWSDKDVERCIATKPKGVYEK
jgi:hypothetical protein